jgi:hypothetical protein
MTLNGRGCKPNAINSTGGATIKDCPYLSGIKRRGNPVLDGVCNPVRNVLELKRYGRGCKPRPIMTLFIIKSKFYA